MVIPLIVPQLIRFVNKNPSIKLKLVLPLCISLVLSMNIINESHSAKNKNTDRTMMEQFVLVSAIGYFPLICLSHWISMIFFTFVVFSVGF